MTCLTATPSREVGQTLASATSKWGLNREARAAVLRIRTGPPECQPKLWDSQREKERERENFPAKSSNLGHCQARSQNKGLSEYQRRASHLGTGPSPAGGREASGWQPEPEKGNLGPRGGILYQTAAGSQLLAKSSFLGPWTVDVRQEGRSQRSAPQRRHTAHPRRRNRAAGTGGRGGGVRLPAPPGESVLLKHLGT